MTKYTQKKFRILDVTPEEEAKILNKVNSTYDKVIDEFLKSGKQIGKIDTKKPYKITGKIPGDLELYIQEKLQQKTIVSATGGTDKNGNLFESIGRTNRDKDFKGFIKEILAGYVGPNQERYYVSKVEE